MPYKIRLGTSLYTLSMLRWGYWDRRFRNLTLGPVLLRPKPTGNHQYHRHLRLVSKYSRKRQEPLTDEQRSHIPHFRVSGDNRWVADHLFLACIAGLLRNYYLDAIDSSCSRRLNHHVQ